MKIQEALAHCDIPCKIYDPIVIQIAALTVVRIIDIIEEKKLDPSKSEDSAELSRLTLEKENQARIVKDETRIIWGDILRSLRLKLFQIFTLLFIPLCFKVPNANKVLEEKMLKNL